MSWVTLIWSAAGGATLALACVHFILWCRDRSGWANLALSFTAVSMVAHAALELGMMYAPSPEAFGTMLRWSHLTAFLIIGGVGEAVHNPWMWVAQAAFVGWLVYVVDASWTLWEMDPTTHPSAELFLEDHDRAAFDCLLLDIQLGGMSGSELQARMAANGETLPVIFITAHDEPGAQPLCRFPAQERSRQRGHQRHPQNHSITPDIPALISS